MHFMPSECFQALKKFSICLQLLTKEKKSKGVICLTP